MMDSRGLDARLTKIENMLTYLVSLEEEYDQENSEEEEPEEESNENKSKIKAKEYNE